MSGEGGAGRGRPSILATVGTDHHPFDRLVDWLETWLGAHPDRAEVFVQYGASRRPTRCQGESLIPHDELSRRIASAQVILCHGGPGTIIDCLRAGTKPIVLPRRHAQGEHVDDHQRRFAKRLEEAGYIRVAESPEDLASLMELALSGAPEFRAEPTEDHVAETIRRFDDITAGLIDRGEQIRVLYIGGWGRSGSTLLDRLLGQVPGSCSVGEMRDLWLRGVIEDRRCGCGEPFGACPFWQEVGRHALGGWSREHAEELHRLRMRFDRPWMVPVLANGLYRSHDLDLYVETTARVYRAIADVSGATTIIDSTKIPSYAYVLRRIPEIDLRFLHLVRDSRGVVHSWQRSVTRRDSSHRPDEMIRYGAVSASGRYVLYNWTSGLVRGSRIPYRFARYEDLVADPQEVVTEIARFADLEVDGVDFLAGHDATLRTSHSVDGNPMRFSSGRLTIAADESWRRGMSPRDRQVVTALTGPLLRRYGYT